jgi:serine O-acetyltransferase
VLGSVVIGENAKIGAGTIVIHNVPADSTVVGNPGRPVRERGRKVGAADVDWTHLPDPVADAMQSLVRRVVEMENEFKEAFPEKCAEIEKAQEEGERELDRVFDYYHGSGI